ncbi:MAG TPA: A24 family peptidase [Gemmataceae bacterium]|jgi:prepilin peptidase CpaA
MLTSLPTPVAVVLVASLALAFIDVYKFKIYNVLIYPLLLAGLIYHVLAGGVPSLANSLAGMLVGFAIFFPFYALGGVGGGDVKLLAAIGAWLGLPLTFAVFLASSLLAGLYALILVVAYGRVRETYLNLRIGWLRVKALSRHLGVDDRIETEVKQLDRGRRIIPFAAMVALGLFLLLLASRLLSKP